MLRKCKLKTTVKYYFISTQFSSVRFSHSVVSDSLQLHESQHARPPSITISRSPPKPKSIESVMPSNHLPTTQEKTLYMDITDGQHQNQIDYILCSQRWRSSIQSAKTRPGADCGSDHELLSAKFRLKLKKAGKTTRPFRYDLNKIP